MNSKIKTLNERIDDVNELGRLLLVDRDVYIGDNPTTYQVVEAIERIPQWKDLKTVNYSGSSFSEDGTEVMTIETDEKDIANISFVKNKDTGLITEFYNDVSKQTIPISYDQDGRIITIGDAEFSFENLDFSDLPYEEIKKVEYIKEIDRDLLKITLLDEDNEESNDTELEIDLFFDEQGNIEKFQIGELEWAAEYNENKTLIKLAETEINFDGYIDNTDSGVEDCSEFSIEDSFDFRLEISGPEGQAEEIELLSTRNFKKWLRSLLLNIKPFQIEQRDFYGIHGTMTSVKDSSNKTKNFVVVTPTGQTTSNLYGWANNVASLCAFSPSAPYKGLQVRVGPETEEEFTKESYGLDGYLGGAPKLTLVHTNQENEKSNSTQFSFTSQDLGIDGYAIQQIGLFKEIVSNSSASTSLFAVAKLPTPLMLRKEETWNFTLTISIK
jgi:hypothetical protein